MKFVKKSKEQLHREDLERIAKYRPLDDDFMRELFRDNMPLTEMVFANHHRQAGFGCHQSGNAVRPESDCGCKVAVPGCFCNGQQEPEIQP